MSCFHNLSIISLSSLIGLTVLSPVALATTPVNSSRMVDHVCYMELFDGSVVNLGHLCGTTTRRQAEQAADPGIINLRRGNEQLLTEMQQLQAALRLAHTDQERTALRQQFEERLPYSDRVRQLQEQERTLRQQLRGTNNPAEQQRLTRQVNRLRQQIRQDPSHQAVRQSRSQVFQQLNR